MKIVNQIDNLGSIYPNIFLTIGNFDGVHLGHRKIVKTVISHAAQYGGTSVVLTFHPHPSKILAPAKGLQFITTLAEKKDALRSLGLEVLLVAEFSRQFSRITPSEFISEVLHLKLKTKYLAIGPDWAFGRDRAGGLLLLKEMSHRYGYRVEVVEPVVIGDTVVSSTNIRDFLASGDVGRAADLLGRPFSVYGRISQEDQMGSEEENSRPFFIEVDEDKLIPPDGTYRLELKTPEDCSSQAIATDCCIRSSYREEGQKRISISPLGGDFQSFKGKWSREVEIRFREKK